VTAATLHPRLQEIADDFNALPEAERLQLLLEFAQELPSLPPRYAEHPDLLEPVPECQSPLFLAVEVEPDATVHLFFDAPREAPTTRGFAGILHTGLDGLSADEVLATPAEFTSPARAAGPGEPAAAARHGSDAGPDQAPNPRAAQLTARQAPPNTSSPSASERGRHARHTRRNGLIWWTGNRLLFRTFLGLAGQAGAG
jgi:cysteine desulfuration protein SufE